MNIQEFFEWVQIVAAIITVMLVPSAFNLVRYFFRKRIVASFTPADPENFSTPYTWKISIENKTGSFSDFAIYCYPSNRGNIIGFWKARRMPSWKRVDHSVSNGLLIFSPRFLPSNSRIEGYLYFDSPSYPRFFCPDFQVQEKLIDPPYDSSPQFMVFVAQIRVLLLAGVFFFVSILALLRLLYMGLFLA